MRLREKELEDCLREGRRIANLTVRKTAEVDAWHKEADRLLEGPDDDPTQRWDDSEREEHRRFVRRLFRYHQ